MTHPALLVERTSQAFSADPAALVQTWLARLERGWRSRVAPDIADLFAGDSHWRDCVALTGDLQTVSGSREIADALARVAEPGWDLRVADGRTPPRLVKRAGVDVIEAIVELDTVWGPASGVVRLLDRPDQAPVAWMWHTSLSGLYARPEDDQPGPAAAGRAPERAQPDPAVVVVGAGHAGLGVAACLAKLGVDTLVIDRLPRVGDVWRNRYESLVLHNESHLDHLPYLPFPPTMPRFLPRDTVADWLEAYAEAMDLRVWTDTELVTAVHEADAWTVVVRRAGHQCVLRPRHVVMAVGTNALPVLPSEPGMDTFGGMILHTSQYRSGEPWAGRRALVLGTGSSAHDIAQDLHSHGAAVTMVQRGPTLVVSLEEAQKVYGIQAEGLPVADSDLLSAATPYPVLVQGNKILAAAARAADRELLEGLAARGFRLDDGAPDATGFQLKLLRRNGGYYVNVGCSELLVAGEIDLLHHEVIDRFVPSGVRTVDGSVVPADLVVAGTGYLRQIDVVRRHFGDQMADQVGLVWGFDAAGEQRNMWQRTDQPGLWFTGGGFPQARVYSRFLALQVAMVELGILPPARGGNQSAAAPAVRSTGAGARR